MDFPTFQTHAFRTWNSKQDFDKQLDNLTLGLVEEIGEVAEAYMKDDVKKMCEEFGDVFFYIANTCTLLEITFDDDDDITRDPRINSDHYFRAAFHLASKIAGMVKKYLHHGHELDQEKLENTIGALFYCMQKFIHHLEFSFTEVAEMNVHKLMIRYPNGFEKERSVNRVDPI